MGVCSEVLSGVGWNLDPEICMDFKSWKAPREVAGARPWPLTVLFVAKGERRERDVSLGQPLGGALRRGSFLLLRGALGAPVFPASSRRGAAGS